jgi:hypothetical protein
LSALLLWSEGFWSLYYGDVCVSESCLVPFLVLKVVVGVRTLPLVMTFDSPLLGKVDAQVGLFFDVVPLDEIPTVKPMS